MLSKKYRLSTSFFKENVKEEKRPNKTFAGKFFLVKIYSSEKEYSCFAVVAAMSSFKKSTLRNYFRRRIYDFIRKNNFHKKPNRNVVIILKPDIIKASFQDWESELTEFIN